MSVDISAAKIFNDFKGLKDLRTAARENDINAIREVAKQFESFMLQMVFKSMREANNAFRSDLLGGDQMEFYEGMFDQQLSLEMSGKFGLADMLTKQLIQSTEALKNTDVNLNQFNHSVESNIMQKTKVSITDEVKNIVNNAPSFIESTFVSPSDFVDKLWSYAQTFASKIKVDPKALLAQAALETGWGQHINQHEDGKSSYNLFNIKADKSWQNEKVVVNTLEYENGQAKSQIDSFRSYQSFFDSFSDYVSFLRDNPRYQNLIDKQLTSHEYASRLQKSGYATDPQYANKIKNILNSGIFAKIGDNI